MKPLARKEGLVVTELPDELLVYDLERHRADRVITEQYPEIGYTFRMTDLQAAMGLAQLEKLESICETRNRLGDMLTGLIEGVPGIHPHRVPPEGRCTYWFYMFRMEPEVLGVGLEEYVSALQAEGVRAAAGYIDRPVYLWGLFADRNAYPRSGCPWECPAYGGAVEYEEGLCPNAEAVLKTAVRVPINEFHTETDIQETAAAVRKLAAYYAGERERASAG